MNILVSDKWLREYVRMKQDPEAFAAAISLIGPSVDRLNKAGAGLDLVVVGKIVALAKHPNADKLRLATVDLGGEKLQVVCGGTNLSEGQLVAFAKIGAKVRWHGEGELVTLAPAEIRGVRSSGMICGANELGLFDRYPHGEKEIMDLTSTGAASGTPLAKALRLDDVIYDIEVTTNRPDALGMVGLAREAAAATGGEFLWKESKLPKSKTPATGFKVNIHSKKLCSRYLGVCVSGVAVGSSPAWMQERLVSAGLRPINAVVDITNYVMLEIGQPMHAFDADKVKGGAINVRNAKAGEKIVALDGNKLELSPETLVIADAEGPIAVAGVIGGKASGVTESTKNIILEAASFNGTSIRRTARSLNTRTDAVMRFEKNLPQGLVGPAMARAVELVLAVCGGEIIAVKDAIAELPRAPRISMAVKALTDRIGLPLSPALIKKNLSVLGFDAKVTAAKISVKVPYWRVGDISIPEDLTEEVARVYGYHRLPSFMPPGVSDETVQPEFAVEEKVRAALVGAGALEFMSLSLVGDELLRKSGEGETPVVRLANPLASDLNTLRPSHRARLLDGVRMNEKSIDRGCAFEIGNVFTPAVDAGELPDERSSLGLAVWGTDEKGGAFYEAKGLLARAAAVLRVPVSFGKDFPKNDFWHPSRSASVHIGSAIVGTLGELTPGARQAAGVESRVALALVDLREFVKAAKASSEYEQPSEYPPVLRDIAFVADRKTEHEFIVAAVMAVDPLIAKVELFDHYEGSGIPEGRKSLAYHLTYQSFDRTLTAEEVDGVNEKVSRMLEHKFGAVVRT
jgi:phenylalanyl-tRNA synthetase beta chain